MFAKNEKIYGVHSNFEEDLSQYTIKLERKDSAEFKYDILISFFVFIIILLILFHKTWNKLRFNLKHWFKHKLNYFLYEIDTVS